MARHQYQCIASVRPLPADAGSNGFLVAACGSKLLSTRIEDGAVVSEWRSTSPVEANAENHEHEDGPPAKKQKTMQASLNEPYVIQLAVSPNQRHMLAVTDDKCVRVFSIGGGGKLSELSQRYMPKRPCAIQILPDNATILCGDKFGDVYSLPLLPQTDAGPRDTLSEVQHKALGTVAGTKPVDFKPSATNLTVHTMRNRKALEAQLKQKEFATKKEPLKFEHKLLLGHVSMLTDLTFAMREVDGKQRRYIITADRDEHIRVSRAPPQSHVIEGFCLGHIEFISKICVIPGTDLLVSGGGDDWLGIWDWTTFELKKKVRLSIHDIVNSASVPPSSTVEASPVTQPQKTAVSGLWVIPILIGDDRWSQAILVACERLSSFFVIPVDTLLSSNTAELSHPVMHSEGPVLDIAVVHQSVVISVDPTSVGERDNDGRRLKAYHFGLPLGPGLVWSAPDDELEKHLYALNHASSAEVDDKKLDGLLYTVSQMRKRRDWEAHEEVVEGEGEDEG